MPTFDETSKARAAEISPYPPFFESSTLEPWRKILPFSVSTTVAVSITLSSSAAIKLANLNVDPGSWLSQTA